MFGFIFGSACLVALAVVTARGRGWRGRRFAHFRGGPRRAMHWVLDRLDTTPGQERVIREAFDDFVDAVRPLREDLSGSREDLARALRGEALDYTALSAAFTAHDGVLAKSREELTTLFGRVHETLDERQRDVLSDLIEAGPWRALRRGC